MQAEQRSEHQIIGLLPSTVPTTRTNCISIMVIYTTSLSQLHYKYVLFALYKLFINLTLLKEGGLPPKIYGLNRTFTGI